MLTAISNLDVGRHFAVEMTDADPPTDDSDAHALADQPPWHRIGIAVDLDTQSACTLRTSSRALANGGAPAIERKAPDSARRKRSIGASPVASPVVPCMGGSVTSRMQPWRWAPQPRPTLDTQAGDGVLLHIADSALSLPLVRTRSWWATSP